MADVNFVELDLSCVSWQAAQKVADVLLEQDLVERVEFIKIKSRYRSQQRIPQAEEVKLIIRTIPGNFDKVEREVTKLQNHKTVDLQMLPIASLSSGVV